MKHKKTIEDSRKSQHTTESMQKAINLCKIEARVEELTLELLEKREMWVKFNGGEGSCYIDFTPMKKGLTKALQDTIKDTEERVIGEMKMEEMVWAEPLVGSELETWNRAVKYFNDKINKLKKI